MDIGLGALIRFANASQQARPRLARKIAEEAQSDYDPATDYWRPVRQAIARDRRTSRDGAALRQVALAATPLRRPNFEVISEQWEDVAGRWADAHYAGAKSKFVDLNGTRVRMTPLFVEEWNDGHAERAYVWFNKEELKPDTVQAIQHLLARGHETDASAQPVLIDMRRGAITPAPPVGNMNEWLDDLGGEFRRLSEG